MESPITAEISEEYVERELLIRSKLTFLLLFIFYFQSGSKVIYTYGEH